MVLVLADDDGLPSPDLVLLLLVTSSGAEPYPLVQVPRRHPPSSLAAHQLGPTVESQDPDAQPLSDGAAWWTNRWSSQLPHGLLRSDGVPEPEGPASLEGSAGNGPTRRGKGSVRLAAWWRSVVAVVLGVDPVDQ
jgi:hypothetical protein